MTGFVGVLDTAIYQMATGRQSGPTATSSAVITLGAHQLDLARAGRLGVKGILHRASNGMAVDPSYKVVAEAAKLNGLHVSGYSYLRPNEPGTAEDHADLFITALLDGPTPTLPAMADVEDFHGIDAWRGQRYADWLHRWLERVEDGTGRRPLIYSYRWLWSSLLAGHVGDFTAYESVIAAYPHQPDAATKQHLWPRPPVDGGDPWWQWATSTVALGDGSLDAGYPSGPDPLPGWSKWSMWQVGSFGRARDYGFDASSNIDINVVPADVWSRWTESAGPAPEPSPFPLPQPAPVPAPPKEPDVPETTYPCGYARGELTMAQMRALYEPGMHPGFAADLFPWIESMGGVVGIGSGLRLVQPDKPGFAPAGKSFHLRQKFRSGIVAFSAVDLVVRTKNGNHSSGAVPWALMPVQGSAKAKEAGVHCNVSTESWHMQDTLIDGFDSWDRAGRPDPVANGKLAPFVPADPVLIPSATLREGSTGPHVAALINVTKFWGWYPAEHRDDVNDAIFGARLLAGVKAMQAALGLTVDGVYGPKSEAALRTFLADMETIGDNTPPPLTTVTGVDAVGLVAHDPPQQGWPVLLIQLALNAFRHQRGESQLVTDGVYGILTIAAVQEFQTAKGLTPDGNVGAKTWTSFLTGKVWS